MDLYRVPLSASPACSAPMRCGAGSSTNKMVLEGSHETSDIFNENIQKKKRFGVLFFEIRREAPIFFVEVFDFFLKIRTGEKN